MVLHDSLRNLALLKIDVAEIIAHVGAFGIQSDRFKIMRLCFFQLVFVRQRVSDFVMRFDIVGLQPQSLPKLRDSFIQPVGS